MAPEFLDSSISPSEKVDIYSFGMILYEIANNLIPFHEYADSSSSYCTS